MRLSLIVPLLLATSVLGFGQQSLPRMTSVEPGNGKVGDVITVAGENLQKDMVAKVYLTDGKNDFLAEVVEQAEKELKIKIPAKTSGARFSLMILTTGKGPKLIEQPVKVSVDE